MKKTEVSTLKAPKAVGPYSQAVSAGGFLFLSGQIGIDPHTGKLVKGGAEPQAKQVLKNIEEILKNSNLTEKDCVKSVIYLSNIEDYAVVNRVYSVFFSEPYPSRAAVEVAALPLKAAVEIEVTALLS